MSTELSQAFSRVSVRLLEGMVADAPEVLREQYGLASDTDDDTLAQRMVEQAAAFALERLAPSRSVAFDDMPERPSLMGVTLTASFLDVLGTRTKHTDFRVEKLEDPRALVAVLRAGSLRQRRSAAERLGDLLEKGKSRKADPDPNGEVTHLLLYHRDPELEVELRDMRFRLLGTKSREARLFRDGFLALLQGMEQAIRKFWETEGQIEPLTSLSEPDRMRLLKDIKKAPDPVVAHVSAVLEGQDGVAPRELRALWLRALRYCDDPRLVPGLRVVLEGGESSVANEAAQCLGGIDDPRVHPILLSAYHRSASEFSRATLAGALGMLGDRIGLEYVRSLTKSEDPAVIQAAFEALASVGTAEDAQVAYRWLSKPDMAADHNLRVQAVRMLQRIGDSRALVPLLELREATGGEDSFLVSLSEEAELAIHARLELIGEGNPSSPAASKAAAKLARATNRSKRGSLTASWRSGLDYFIASFWRMCGMSDRAVIRFETAAARRYSWIPPIMAVAKLHMNAHQYTLALHAFRRILSYERSAIELDAKWLALCVKCFAGRADEVEREGRIEIVRGLLGEILALDLRLLPTLERLALARRYDQASQRLDP